MKNLLTLLVAIILSVSISHFLDSKIMMHDAPVTVRDHVMKTGVLRCGYLMRAPLFVIDPNTKKMSGIMYDVTNELAKRLNLKIDWVEETTMADFAAGLNNRRFDTMCGGSWLFSNRAREIDFTQPIFYETASVYMRQNDEKNEQDLNLPLTRFAVLEGTISSYLTRDRFPAAARLAVPENAVYPQVLLDVVAHKADAAIFPDTDGHLFDIKNPDKVKRSDKIRPLGVFAVTYPTARGEDAWRQVLNNTISDMQNQRIIDKILDRYPDFENVIKRARKNYD